MTKKKNNGFTLAELIITITISSILLMVLSFLLLYSFTSWWDMRSSMEVRRDADHAMDMLARAIRPAEEADISILPDGMTLTIGAGSFYIQGGSLWHDPDTGTSGDEIVIAGGVTGPGFAYGNFPNSVTVDMTLTGRNDTITIDQASIEWRR